MNNGNGMGSLKGRVALVTGGARGIGRAIALELAHRGATVAINYQTRVDAAQQVADMIHEMGGECMLVQGNVSSPEDARLVVKCVLDECKRIDILVNNAGIARDKSIRKLGEAEWAEVINVNLNGTFYCTAAVLPAMIEQKYGRIINVTSLIGQTGGFGQANYAASKGGITAFTKSIALELAKFNITANCVSPGYTCTEMVAAIPEEVLAQIRSKIPLGRLAKPEEIAKATGFLAADGDYITGQTLAVNGGICMQ